MDTESFGQFKGAVSRRTFLLGTGLGLTAATALNGQQKPVATQTECVFCKIVAGTLFSHKLWENKEFLAFLDNKPITPGHTLLIPRSHYDYLFDMPAPLYERAMKRVRMLSAPLGIAMGSKRIGIMVEGFGVAHCHIHLVPISKGGELVQKGKTGVSNEEFESVAVKVREAFARTGRQ